MNPRLDISVHCAVDARCTIGESPVWDDDTSSLYWVDIPPGIVHCWQPASGERQQWQLPSAVGSIGLRAAGGLVVALRSGFHTFEPQTRALRFLCNPEPDCADTRLNDGKVSPDGRFWAGTMDERADKQPVGGLYRLDPDHRCRRMAGEVCVSNGLAWSPDGRTMYHSDSRGGAIYRHSYDPASGDIGPREVFVHMQPEWGRPDGGATDVEGCYWSCGLSASRLNRFSPDGELVGWVPMPVTHPTMPCFGGPQRRTLWVTSLSEGLNADQLARTPLAGAVFTLDVGVAGSPVPKYLG